MVEGGKDSKKRFLISKMNPNGMRRPREASAITRNVSPPAEDSEAGYSEGADAI